MVSTRSNQIDLISGKSLKAIVDLCLFDMIEPQGCCSPCPPTTDFPAKRFLQFSAPPPPTSLLAC